LTDNGADGIRVDTSDTVSIFANYVGTDQSNDPALGNMGDGIRVANSTNVTIGGPLATDGPGAANVISNNLGNGVEVVTDSAATDPHIQLQPNYVSGNQQNGIAINGNGVLVDENFVYSNVYDGIKISGDSNTVEYSYIGTDLAGDPNLDNGADGVELINATNTLIGQWTLPDGTPAANYIWNNGGSGVGEVGSFAGNSILSNSIYNNGGLGIDLGEDGVTAPYLILPAGGTGWAFFHGAANTDYLFQFFVSPTPDPTGYGEGLQAANVAVAYPVGGALTDANGNLSFYITCSNSGMWLSATVTDLTTGTTSEFCLDVHVSAGGPGGP
jgi:hypothetical protein